MMLVLGPIIFGLIFGLIIGASIRKTSFNFTATSYIVMIIAALLVAWQIGQFDFYNDIPVATGFVSGLIGLLLGRLLFGRGS